MLSSDIVRQEIPRFTVLTQEPGGILKPTSQMLADEVYGDLTCTQARVVEAFGAKDIPPLDTFIAESISQYFQERRWTIPKSVLINPERDGAELRSILQKSQFRSVADEEFFTGLNGKAMSSGASPQRDLVIFHDMPKRFAREVLETVRSWDYTIDNDELRKIVELCAAEYTIHELAHLAGGLAISAVVIEKNETDGAYCLTDRTSDGFTDVQDNIPSALLDEESGYYCGDALDEGWAAHHASSLVLKLQGYEDREKMEIENRYYIKGTVVDSQGDSSLEDVGALSSNEAGMILDKLDNQYPGIISIMTQVADRTMVQHEVLSIMRTMLPSNIMKLLLDPKYESWQSLVKNLNIQL
jgi:hypothetical protein